MPTECKSGNLQEGISYHRKVLFVANSFNWFSYFGDEEDVIDSTLAPEQQAGQFAFGSTIDPSAQQQFNFGEDVNMS